MPFTKDAPKDGYKKHGNSLREKNTGIPHEKTPEANGSERQPFGSEQ